MVITGATGFVGSNLTRYLLERKIEVYIIVRPTSDITFLEKNDDNLNIFTYDQDIKKLISFFSEIQPDSVFHLASNIVAEHKSNQIDSLIQSNITFGLHLLEAMKETGVKKLVNTGTFWQHYNNDDYNPVCLYAATKQAFESLIEYYVQANGFKVVTLKLFDTYGENDKRPKLINLLNKFADEQTELNMSPGEQVLNLVHVNDVCHAFYSAQELLHNNKDSYHLKYCVANSKTHTLKEVIEIFELVSNKKVNVIWGGRPYRKREVMKPWVNGEVLPNWEANISLEEGLKRIKLYQF